MLYRAHQPRRPSERPIPKQPRWEPHPDAVAAAGRLARAVAADQLRDELADLELAQAVPDLCGLEACDLSGFCQARTPCQDATDDDDDDLTALARAAGVFRPTPAPDYDDLGDELAAQVNRDIEHSRRRAYRRLFGDDLAAELDARQYHPAFGSEL